MIDTIGNWLTAVLGWFGIIPQPAWAVFFGLLIGGVGTQWLKRTFPLHMLFPNESKEMYVFKIRVVALFLAAVPTFMLWPAGDKYRVWIAIGVGFCCPTIYKAVTHFLYKRWPDLERRLSGTQ